ncbi:membrane integrity-associated transporter subunit PqiC [Paracoccus sp. p4-l81]
MTTVFPTAVFRAAAVALCLPLALAACSNPEKTGRYLIDRPVPAKQMANRLGKAELREVSLPEYASGQEVPWQTADGAVRSNPDTLWADTQARAVTHFLAREISAVSGATVISEPWPLAEPPSNRVEVRVERMLATADGLFNLSGRYFVAPEGLDGFAGGGDTVRRFDIQVPLAGEGPAAIAAAQSQALAQLAAQIAALR